MTYQRIGSSVASQLAARVRAQIEDGVLRPGQRVPSEKALTREYGVALGTVHGALMELRREGLLEVREGIGTFVRQRADCPAFPLVGGDRIRIRMPSPQERHELGFPEGVPLILVTNAAGEECAVHGDSTLWVSSPGASPDGASEASPVPRRAVAAASGGR